MHLLPPRTAHVPGMGFLATRNPTGTREPGTAEWIPSEHLSPSMIAVVVLLSLIFIVSIYIAILLRRRHQGGKWPFKTTDPVELLAKVSIRWEGTHLASPTTAQKPRLERNKGTRSAQERISKKEVKEEEFELEVRNATCSICLCPLMLPEADTKILVPKRPQSPQPAHITSPPKAGTPSLTAPVPGRSLLRLPRLISSPTSRNSPKNVHPSPQAEAEREPDAALLRLKACHHSFHAICLTRWIERPRYDCPVCRQNCLDVRNGNKKAKKSWLRVVFGEGAARR